jgi:hypothetical protein
MVVHMSLMSLVVARGSQLDVLMGTTIRVLSSSWRIDGLNMIHGDNRNRT